MKDIEEYEKAIENLLERCKEVDCEINPPPDKIVFYQGIKVAHIYPGKDVKYRALVKGKSYPVKEPADAKNVWEMIKSKIIDVGSKDISKEVNERIREEREKIKKEVMESKNKELMQKLNGSPKPKE